VIHREEAFMRTSVWTFAPKTNTSLKSMALAASPKNGETLKISSIVRSVELCVKWLVVE